MNTQFSQSLRCARAGLTLIEVMVSVLLIAVGLGSIFAINSECAHILRAAQQASVASLILQQRVEEMRAKSWAEISSATGLVQVMETPTSSEHESGPVFTEILTVSPLDTSEKKLKGSATRTFRVRRENGTARIESDEDLSAFPALLFESVVQWTHRGRAKERSQRCIICRSGLTRTGIFGSTVGRMQTASMQ